MLLSEFQKMAEFHACVTKIFYPGIYQVNLYMLTKDEKLFIEYWEKNREKEKTLRRLLAGGIPVGLVFALPVLVAVIFHNWYKSMSYISGSQIIVITIGVLCVAVFFAIFRMKFKWENNEQLYKELKFKAQHDDAAN